MIRISNERASILRIFRRSLVDGREILVDELSPGEEIELDPGDVYLLSFAPRARMIEGVIS